tara:strand:+ start:49082 stop:49846 length:765 start_codon:yes stop_codon:yes gene_type:complete
MLRFLDRYKFGLLGTLIFHFLFLLSATYVHIPDKVAEKESLLVIDFPEETILPDEDQKEAATTQKIIDNNSNKGKNEAAPNEVKKGDYNEFNKEPSKASKESFDEQLERELKELEQEVIQEQRDAGYGYSPEEVAKMLSSKENKELEKVASQAPRSESVFEGNTNITYKLKNRYDTHLNVPVYMCQYGGLVVVNIAVNQQGKVVSAKVDKESSKTTDPCLLDAALSGAKNTRFNSKSSASKIQMGSITYRFIDQ